MATQSSPAHQPPTTRLCRRGCGERTGNLFPVSSFTGKSNIVLNDFNSASETIEFLPNTQYTISLDYSSTLQTGVFKITFVYTDETRTSSDWLYATTHKTLTSNAEKTVSSISLTDYAQYVDVTISDIMLNTGSTALPYEPYGQYKIPISSAGQTTPIYLGEVQSTRRVKKLVLDGTEEWERAGYPEYNTYFRIPRFTIGQEGKVVCSHYVSPDTNISVGNTVQGVKIQNSTELIRVLIVRPPEFAVWSVDDFKAYLAQQYANGTPVTIWCVLATEETGIVNEPLRKIGDYADTVSKEQAGVQIPTNKGSTTLDVLTAVKPSNVSIKYRV